jgi:hypothetical protein
MEGLPVYRGPNDHASQVSSSEEQPFQNQRHQQSPPTTLSEERLR